MYPMGPLNRVPRLLPLAAALSTLFSVASPPCLAGVTHFVTSCDDSASAATTPGTLRYEVAHAAPNDGVEINTLPGTCASTITLKQGAIVVGQSDLSIFGQNPVTIDANNADRVFKHTGTGILDVNNLYLKNGKYLNEHAAGGCIYSAGRVILSFSTISGCLARQASGADTAAKARGGAIFAKLNVNVYSSIVSGNEADASPDANSAGAFGGGIYTGANLSLRASTLEDNFAVGSGFVAGDSDGGGAWVASGSSIYYSTVSGNHADFNGGIFGPGNVFINTIINSTVSGNYGNIGVGGITFNAAAKVSNSTIAFNHGVFGAGGLEIGGSAGYLHLYSTIIADNVGAGDLDFEPADLTKLKGSANLVMTSNVISPVTGLSSDPLLAPLAFHGGPTRTHALLPGSPALATGDNPENLDHDQRGSGFSRTGFVLSFVYTDIGAYQVQMFDDDEIFYDGFRTPGG